MENSFPNWAAGTVSVATIGALIGAIIWIVKRLIGKTIPEIVERHEENHREINRRFVIELRRARRSFASEIQAQREQCSRQILHIDALWSNRVKSMEETHARLAELMDRVSVHLERLGK